MLRRPPPASATPPPPAPPASTPPPPPPPTPPRRRGSSAASSPSTSAGRRRAPPTGQLLPNLSTPSLHAHPAPPSPCPPRVRQAQVSAEEQVNLRILSFDTWLRAQLCSALRGAAPRRQKSPPAPGRAASAEGAECDGLPRRACARSQTRGASRPSTPAPRSTPPVRPAPLPATFTDPRSQVRLRALALTPAPASLPRRRGACPGPMTRGGGPRRSRGLPRRRSRGYALRCRALRALLELTLSCCGCEGTRGN